MFHGSQNTIGLYVLYWTLWTSHGYTNSQTSHLTFSQTGELAHAAFDSSCLLMWVF